MESSPTKLLTVGEDLLRVFCKSLYLRFYVSSNHWKTLYSKEFADNLRHVFIREHLQWEFLQITLQSRFYFNIFLSFETKNKNQFFSKLVVRQRKLLVLFITSRYFCVFFYKISNDFAFSISERIISHIWVARKYILSVPK